ncbi:MAG: vitamin B12 dependent methionine synthase [Anaerolineaceae bacterium]|nr:vitamin B12 dependent methionine synthase [Anaerolineaceae bacterium]
MAILDQIPFQPNVETLCRRLRIASGNDLEADLLRLVAEATAIARPKVDYMVAGIDDKSAADQVVIQGIPLTSRVLRVNLEQARRVFIYVATCGTELEAWAASKTDMLERYWADEINELALHTALAALDKHLTEMYQPGPTSDMNPGSLADWPLTEQRAVFTLLGDPAATIGVRLTDSYLMLPVKSVSGLRFPTEQSFESCQLCPIENCPARRAPYSQDLFAAKYEPQASNNTTD